MGCVVEIFSDHGQAPCIIEGTTTRSYAEVRDALRVTRATLSEQGVESHSVVALCTDRDTASIVTLLALLDMGCSVLLTHSRWPQPMVAEAITRVAARHLVTPHALESITVQPLPHPHHTPSWATEAAVIVATSGSTGTPKLALLSFLSLVRSAQTIAHACRLTPSDCWHLSLPLFHVGGLGILLRVVGTGSSLSLAPDLHGAHGTVLTHVSLVPTQLYRLLRDPAAHAALHRTKAILIGGAPIGAHLVADALTLGLPVMTSYGLTEMGSAVTIASANLLREGGVVSLGAPLPGRDMRVTHDGEVQTRGETVCKGYISRDGLSVPVSEEGWFSTGDVGQMLHDGTLAIIGRKDAQFISGGENIHPEMIEHALTALPELGILAACVVPVPDEEFGSRPYAFVVCERATPEIERVRNLLRATIPAFALPIGIQEAPPTLLTSTGKINRAAALQAARADSPAG